VHYLTYGEVHKRANRLGLVMSRDRMTGRVNLRFREAGVDGREWPRLTLHDALRVVQSLEG
jgi:hypothetical protein